MIHTSPKQKVVEKGIILTYEPMRGHNDFQVTHIPLILNLESMEYFIQNLVPQQCTTIQSKQLCVLQTTLRVLIMTIEYP